MSKNKFNWEKAEAEFSRFDALPDCVPSNVREWQAFAEQVDRMAAMMPEPGHYTVAKWEFYSNAHKRSLMEFMSDMDAGSFAVMVSCGMPSAALINSRHVSYDECVLFHLPGGLKTKNRYVLRMDKSSLEWSRLTQSLRSDCGITVYVVAIDDGVHDDRWTYVYSHGRWNAGQIIWNE